MTNLEVLARAPKLGAKSKSRRQLIKSHINWLPNREKKKKKKKKKKRKKNIKAISEVMNTT